MSLTKQTNKYCFCGKHYEVIPRDAKYFVDNDSEELTGWYWNCECHSTLFQPERVVTMNPGQELDVRVAEDVLGLKVNAPNENEPYPFIQASEFDRPYSVPHFSSDMTAAWALVEKLGILQRDHESNAMGYKYPVQLWQQPDGSWIIGNFEDRFFVLAHGKTAPHAICLAALEIIGRG